MTFELVQPRVNLPVVDLLRAFTNGLEHQGFRVQLRVDTEDVKNNTRSRTVVAASDNVTVADDEEKLPLVVVVQRGQRVDRATQGLLAFRVTRDLAEHELVQHLRIAFGRELQGGQD